MTNSSVVSLLKARNNECILSSNVLMEIQPPDTEHCNFSFYIKSLFSYQELAFQKDSLYSRYFIFPVVAGVSALYFIA